MISLLCANQALATSIFIEGVIIAVKPDFSGYSVKGYDHYNHTRYQDKITEIPVKIAGNCVFVLDNRIMRREFVLAAGRHAYAIGSSAGAMLVVALSEPADRVVGQVTGSEGNKLKLKITIGADSFDTEVPLDADAAYSDGLKPAAREVVAAPGKLVRVLPARKQTVLAYTAKAFENAVPPKTPLAAGGVIKSMEGGAWLLAVAKGDAVEELKPEARKIPVVFDVRGFVGHGQTDLASVGPGSSTVVIGFEKRPGKIDHYVVLQAPDAGRTDGVVKTFDPQKREVTLAVLKPAGLQDTVVTLEAEAAVNLDGKQSGAAEALKPGCQVALFAPRKQTVEALAAPPSPAEKKGPSPTH